MSSDRIELRTCQRNARDAIVEDITRHLSEKDVPERIRLLVAPTGSGKTLIMAKSIKKVAQYCNNNVAFIWLSISKGDLVGQSTNKLKEHLNRSGISILGADDIANATTLAGSLLVLNWDTLNKEDKEGNPLNRVMGSDGDFAKFPALCQATRDAKIPIVLLIDESHTYSATDKSLTIRNKYIQPTYTLEVTATPKYNITPVYTIEYQEAAKAGLIKNDVRRITFLSSEDGLRAGVKKLKEMITLAKSTNAEYDPRILVSYPQYQSRWGFGIGQDVGALGRRRRVDGRIW